MKKNLRIALTLSTLIYGLTPNTTLSATKDWTGSPDYPYWEIPGRWSPAGAPTATDDVRVGVEPADTYRVNILGSAEAASLILANGANVNAESNVDITKTLLIGSNSNLTLYFAAHLNVGKGVTAEDPALILTDSSQLRLLGDFEAPDMNHVQVTGPLVVDNTSEIIGRGVVNAGGGIDLNGKLLTQGFESTLALNYTSTSPDPAQVDLDGSNDTGFLDVAQSNSTMEVPSEFSDPFSGVIVLGMDSWLKFMGPGTTTIDGHISLEPDLSSFTDYGPSVIQGDHLIFADGSFIDFLFGDLNISASTLSIEGNMDMYVSRLEVNTISPWRMAGTLSAADAGQIHGSSMIVGSLTGGEAHIDAWSPISFYAPVTLEESAVLSGLSSGAEWSAFNFYETLTLDSPVINQEYGPWNPLAESAPGDISIYGNLNVTGSTTLYAADATLGFNAIPSIYRIQPDQVLTIDARAVKTRDSVSVIVNHNAEFNVVVQDPSDRTWTNNMDIALDNGTVNAGTVCNRGSITGTGQFNGILLPDYNGLPCAGSIAPGFSPGRLTFIGDVAFNETEFTMEIGGSDPKEYDQVAVKGILQVDNGLLNIHFINGYTPAAGEDMNLFSAVQPMNLDFSAVNIRGLSGDSCFDTKLLQTEGTLKFCKHKPRCNLREIHSLRQFLSCLIQRGF